MTVRTLCLAILQDGEASGYEIRKMCTEGEYSYFVEASFGAIYPALAKLEDEGLVTSRIEVQDGRPAKRLYNLTEAGQQVFIDSLHEPLTEDVYRSPFLMFARYAHLLDADLVQSRIEDRISQLDSQVAELKRVEERLADPEQACEGRGQPNDLWVVRYGIACLEVARNQLQANMHSIIATARRPEPDAARAAE